MQILFDSERQHWVATAYYHERKVHLYKCCCGRRRRKQRSRPTSGKRRTESPQERGNPVQAALIPTVEAPCGAAGVELLPAGRKGSGDPVEAPSTAFTYPAKRPIVTPAPIQAIGPCFCLWRNGPHQELLPKNCATGLEMVSFAQCCGREKDITCWL